MDDAVYARRLTDALGEVVWLADPSFEDLHYLNPAYESLVGASLDDPDVDALRSLHHHAVDEFEAWRETIRSDVRADETDDAYEFRSRYETPNGDDRWLESAAYPIEDGDASTAGIAGITLDLTEHIERERDLETSVERLDEFASMLSHDLRNPISVARGRVELYRMTGDESHLDDVEGALERIEDITMDLTTLARHGSLDAKREPVSLEKVAVAAWGVIDHRDATLEVEDVTIEGDPGQLRALFENLFRNSVGHGGRAVTVRVGPLPDGFFVEDTGRGIPEEIRQDVFEHGFTTGYSGSGVGLTIVGRIADAHGFDVEVAESDEGGARFEFTHH